MACNLEDPTSRLGVGTPLYNHEGNKPKVKDQLVDAKNCMGTPVPSHTCDRSLPDPQQRYPDTKHNLVSFTITALKEVEITATLELLHGTYYSDFDNLLNNVGELFVFTPGRSDYKPLSPSRKSFFFLLNKDDFDDLQVRRHAARIRVGIVPHIHQCKQDCAQRSCYPILDMAAFAIVCKGILW